MPSDDGPEHKTAACPCCDQPVPQAASEAIRKKLQGLQDDLLEMKRRLEVRPGRPPKPPIPGERISLGLKVTAAIKSRLDQAARETGRTQSQEAEVRIERSFDRQDLLSEVLVLAFGRNLAGILIMLGYTMDVAGRHGDWRQDDHAFGQAVEAGALLLEAAKVASLSSKRSRGVPSYGARVAREMISALRGKLTHRGPFLSSDIDAIRSLMGPIALRMAQAEKVASRELERPITEASLPTQKIAAAAAADAALKLINSSPHNPTRQALTAAIEEQFNKTLG